MKAKIYSMYLLATSVFFLLIIYSCEGDFLERAPSNLIDEKEVFSKIENAEAFLNNAYRQLPSLLYRNTLNNPTSYFNLGSGTDEAGEMWHAALTTMDFNNGNWNSTNFPLNWTWFAYYSSIRVTNVLISNHSLIPNEVGSTGIDRKMRLLGEAHGLRAYYYFLLYTQWGEVPIIKDPIKPGDTLNIYTPKSSLDKVVTFIDEELKLAIEYLPPKHEDANFGRFTATAAWALRSRLNLYYASKLSNPENRRDRWEKAAEVTKQAIDYAESNGYSLSLNGNNGKQAYERIFLELNNPEVIWASFSGDGGYWNAWANSLAFSGSWGEGPIQELIDDYEMRSTGEIPVLGYRADNTQLINSKSGYNPLTPYEGRDLRFYQTILYHGATWKGRKINISPNGLDYSADRARVNYFWKKYMLEERNLFTGTGARTQTFVLFRLSELYLNYAEAMNEILEQPNNIITDAINVIRNRGGLPALSLNLTKEEMRDKIRHERRIEFVMENHRFWDVRRWKIAEYIDNQPVRKVDVTSDSRYIYSIYTNRVFDKNKHYLFPIPQTEIEKKPGILTQNPGW